MKKPTHAPKLLLQRAEVLPALLQRLGRARDDARRRVDVALDVFGPRLLRERRRVRRTDDGDVHRALLRWWAVRATDCRVAPSAVAEEEWTARGRTDRFNLTGAVDSLPAEEVCKGGRDVRERRELRRDGDLGTVRDDGSGEGGPAEVEDGMEANRERVEDLDEIAVTRDGDVADEGAGGRATVSTAARNEGMGRTGAQQGRSSSRPGSDPAG